MISEKVCSQCNFYDESENGKANQNVSFGICRYNPPTMVRSDNNGYWPSVKPSDWCGKFSELS